MLYPKTLVTGATGKTGAPVANQLLAAGVPVRALVRQEDARSRALQAAGAEVMVGDMADAEQMLRVMTGVQRAYYCPPVDPHMLQSTAAFAVAARQARLEVVVGLSQWLASPSHPSLMTRQHWLADQLLALLPDVAFTIVNPGFFADNTLALLPYAAHLGLFPSINRESRNAPPSNEDIARVAVAALLNPDRHAGKRYRPTGPTLLSDRDMAAIISRVLDRSVRTIPMPKWMLLRAARLDGYPTHLVSELRYYVDDYRDGAFELGAPTTDVLDVTGRPAEDFETIAERYAARPGLQRSPGNTLRQIARFMRVPVSRGFDLARYDRELRAPHPGRPQFAADSDIWRREHDIAPRGGSSGRSEPDQTSGRSSRCAIVTENTPKNVADGGGEPQQKRSVTRRTNR